MMNRRGRKTAMRSLPFTATVAVYRTRILWSFFLISLQSSLPLQTHTFGSSGL